MALIAFSHFCLRFGFLSRKLLRIGGRRVVAKCFVKLHKLMSLCCQNRLGKKKLGPKIEHKLFSQTFRAPRISRQNPGISRQKSLVSLVSRDIPNFLAPTQLARENPPSKLQASLNVRENCFLEVSCWKTPYQRL